MSPILVRPVREQLEHDRVIRLLQVRLKRRAEVAANIGEDQTVPVRIGQVQIFPDLVLTSTDSGHKLLQTVEVETAESVNHLEAMAQWAHLGRARAPFHLYVPAGCVDMAKRLATENSVNVAEIWSFHTIGDQTRFTLAHRAPTSEPRRAPEQPASKAAAKPAGKPSPKAAARTTRTTAAKSAGVRKRPSPEPRRKVASKSAAKRGAPAVKARTQKRK